MVCSSGKVNWHHLYKVKQKKNQSNTIMCKSWTRSSHITVSQTLPDQRGLCMSACLLWSCPRANVTGSIMAHGWADKNKSLLPCTGVNQSILTAFLLNKPNATYWSMRHLFMEMKTFQSVKTLFQPHSHSILFYPCILKWCCQHENIVFFRTATSSFTDNKFNTRWEFEEKEQKPNQPHL